MAIAWILVLVIGACGSDDGAQVRDGSGTGTGSVTATGVGAGECTPVNPEMEADGDTTVSIDAVDYAFAPAQIEVESGVITFQVANEGEELHELAFLPGGGEVPFDNGAPDEAALEEASAFELEAFRPGQTCKATYNLEPGTYTFFCIVETEDGTTHYELGCGARSWWRDEQQSTAISTGPPPCLPSAGRQSSSTTSFLTSSQGRSTRGCGGRRILTASLRSPLGEVVERVDTMADYVTCRLGLPDELGWVVLGHLDDEGIGGWYQQAMTRFGDRASAALHTAGNLARAVVVAYLVPVVATSRLPLVDLDQLAVRRNDDGHLDGLAWEDEAVGTLPDDPALGTPGVVPVAGREEMLDLAADRIITVEPLFETLRRVVRVGWPALWGDLADQIAGYALWTARTLDTNRQQGWKDAQRVIDVLALRQPHLRARPIPFPVAYSGGQELFQVRGTCCLWYRSSRDSDPDGDGYCTTCPLRTDQSRRRRLVEYLEGVES